MKSQNIVLQEDSRCQGCHFVCLLICLPLELRMRRRKSSLPGRTEGWDLITHINGEPVHGLVHTEVIELPS